MASNSNCREVPLEVYVNGELCCIDSVWVPDEENVQVDFMVTEGIYELLGCSPGDITAQLQVDTDECMSVSRAALEGEDLQIDITCSPTESTTEWMLRKITGLFRTLFWMDPAPEPEVNLVTVRWPAEVPGNKKYSPKRVMKKMSACIQKYFPIDPAEPLCDPETEPELDLVEPKELCNPVPSFPETKPVSTEGQEVNVSDDMDAEKMRKMDAFFQKYFPLDPPETEPVSAEGPEVDVSDGMNASPEMNSPRESTEDETMGAFFKKYFPLDPPETEPVSAEDRKVDVSDGMNASPEINGPRESSKDKKMGAFFKKYFPLDPPETEPVSSRKVDVSDGMNASPEMNSPRESTTEWMLRKISGFFRMLFWMDTAVPEPTPEMNLVSVGWAGSSSGIEKYSPKRESTKDEKMGAFFKKYFPLDPPETEPVSAEDRKVDVSDGMNASPEMNSPRESTNDKKMGAFFKKYFPLDPPETEPVSSRKVDVSDGMNASEMNGPRESTTEWMARKISGFFRMLFWMDPAVPEPTPEMNLVSVGWAGSSSGIEKYSPKRESTKDEKMGAFFKKYFPLDPPETEPVSAEDRKVDVSDGMNASPEINGPRESSKDKKISTFFKKYFPLDRA